MKALVFLQKDASMYQIIPVYKRGIYHLGGLTTCCQYKVVNTKLHEIGNRSSGG